MISAIALHLIAGTVAGSIFAVRTLLALVAIVLLECLAAAIALGFTAGLYAAGGLVAVQVGYLAGIYLRSVLEHAGIAQPSPRTDHSR